MLFMLQAGAKEFSLYSIPESQTKIVKEALETNTQFITDKDIYLLQNSTGNFYLRFYKYSYGTHIFSVSDKELFQEMFLETLINTGINFKEKENKDYREEYKYDFIQYVRNKKLSGFRVMPDKVSKISNMVSEKSEKLMKTETPYASNYLPDFEEINLTVLGKENFQNQELEITKTKYRLKNKSSRKFHACEYILYNNTPNDMMILNAGEESRLTKQNILISVYTDLDKLNTISTAGSLLAPFTFGCSYILKLPELVSNIKTTKELSRFMHDYPKNYVIRPGEHCRILTLCRRDSNIKLKFNLLVNFKESSVEI